MKSRPLQIFRLTSPPSYSSLVETQQSIYAWNTRVPSIVSSPSLVCLASLPSPFHHLLPFFSLSLSFSLFPPLFFTRSRAIQPGAFRSSSSSSLSPFRQSSPAKSPCFPRSHSEIWASSMYDFSFLLAVGNRCSSAESRTNANRLFARRRTTGCRFSDLPTHSGKTERALEINIITRQQR